MAKLRNILAILLTLSLVGRAGERLPGINFHGAWIATVANIDWPSKEAVGDPEKQQAEMTWILDSLASIGINAIIFQVRPTADALYYSELEPVSHWLTGEQSFPSSPLKDSPASFNFYDPLAFVIDEAKKRGIEVHVWLNPYRVNLATMDTALLCADHVWRQHREWFWEYNKQWYFDPGLPITREWICTVVQDIVERYDIQAIHMDDYFYPYPAGGKQIPDTETFAKYPRGFEDIRDWRRDNVNLAIQAISETIRECKDSVEFGISPFGVWRNADVDSTGSATKAGITNYDDLYADIRLWIQKGWIDYVLPQLYWEIGKRVADYEVLAHWWANEVKGTKCKLYIGMAPYRLVETPNATRNPSPVTRNPWNTGNEIGRQMRLNRTIPEISGECFYSTRPLLRNPRGVCDTIRLMYKDDEAQKESDFLPWE